MKKILVPVDFSDTSAAAVRFGIYLAETMKTDLTVMHIFSTALNTSRTISALTRDTEQRQLKNQLKEFVSRNVEPVLTAFHGRLEPSSTINILVLEGMIGQTVLWHSREDETELIVMGGVGVGANLTPSRIFGSVARTVALTGGCPVILIPKDYGFPQVERLALAFDGVDDILRMSDFSRRIIEALRPEVYFVHVLEQDQVREAQQEEEFLELACGPGFPSYIYKSDSLPPGKVTKKLLDYTIEKAINLLVLGGERRGFFERLFEPGHLRPLINHCEVPILIIPFER